MQAPDEMRILRGMRNEEREDVDCAACPATERCWQQRVPMAAGFMVRRVRPLEPGEVLVRAGAPFRAPFIVTSGCLGVIELLADGTERIVAFRLPGEIVGLESPNALAHRYGVQAVSSATVCRLRWHKGGIDGLGSAVLGKLLAKTTLQCEQAAHPWAGLPSVERVRAFIEDFRSRTDQPLPMTRAQIGQYLGIAEETVVRAFAQLRQRGALDLDAPAQRRRNARSHTP